MTNTIAHFAIQADDVDRAQRFYAAAFGWRFEAWGPPGFFRIHTGGEGAPGIEGALYARQVPRSGNDAMIGYRCTIAVADLDGVREAVLANGGSLRGETSTIPGVGTLFEFEDSEGNIVCAMRYD